MAAGSRWNVFSGPTSDIWIYDWDRDTATPLTRHPASELKAVWTPDGRRIAFNSNRDNSPQNLYWQRADGTGNAQRLTESQHSQWPVSWHPSGKFLAFEEHKLGTTDKDWDLMILPMEGDEASGWKPGTPTVFLNSPSAEKEPNFSPDGRWLAYQSNETGRNEVYVRPFRGPARDGGSRRGRHLSNLVAHQTRAVLRRERTNHGRGLCGRGGRVPR